MPEHAKLTIVLALFGAWGLVFFGVLIVPEIPFIYRISVCIADSIFWIVFAVVYFQPPKKSMLKIKQIFTKKYSEKLEYRIKEALEKEAKIKNLTFVQKDARVIPYITPDIARDFIKGLKPKTYVACLGGKIPRSRFDEVNSSALENFIVINESDLHCKGYVLEIPLNEGVILAEKMTEISHNQSYGKKLCFYLFS